MKNLFTITILFCSFVLRSQAYQWEPYNDNLFSIGNIKDPSGYLFKVAPNQWEIVQADATNGPVSVASLGSVSNQIAGSIPSLGTITNIASNQVSVATNTIWGAVTNADNGKQPASITLTNLSNENGIGVTNLISAVQAGSFLCSGNGPYTITFSNSFPSKSYTVCGSSPCLTAFPMNLTNSAAGSFKCLNTGLNGCHIYWVATYWTQ